jgi:hypothetical protein
VCAFDDIPDDAHLALFSTIHDHDAVARHDVKVLHVVHHKGVYWLQPPLQSGFVPVPLRVHWDLGLLDLLSRESAILVHLVANRSVRSQIPELPIFFGIFQGRLPDLLDVFVVPPHALEDGLFGVPALLVERLPLLPLSLAPGDGAFHLPDLLELLRLTSGIAPRLDDQLAHGGCDGAIGVVMSSLRTTEPCAGL